MSLEDSSFERSLVKLKEKKWRLSSQNKSREFFPSMNKLGHPELSKFFIFLQTSHLQASVVFFKSSIIFSLFRLLSTCYIAYFQCHFVAALFIGCGWSHTSLFNTIRT